MNKEYLENIAQNYDLLIPKDKETLLLLVSLFKKIKTGEIEQEFSQYDFETTLSEIETILQRDKNIQFENISKKLSQYFYTTLKDTKTPYQLTIYAKELCDLVENQIQPEYAKLSLKQTFRRNLPLKVEDLESIEDFEHWFLTQFETSKKIIVSHIESLQRFVDLQITDLGDILKTEFDNAKILLEKFLEKFDKVKEKAKDLTDTLNFKTEIIQKIRNSEILFQENKEDWEKYIRIQNEVLYFFENIDKRVLAINEKIQTARIRLKSLYQNLHYKQQYKIKLETFLLHLLEHSKNKKGKIHLPSNIDYKTIPYNKEQFFTIPNIDFDVILLPEIPVTETDIEFENKQKRKNELILKKQESIAKWVNEIDKTLFANTEIEYSEWFEKMYLEEKRYDIPVEVCYGLIERFNKNKNIEITIDKDKPYQIKSEIVLWNMKMKVLNF